MLKRRAAALCLIVLVVLRAQTPIWAQEETIVRFSDRRGDDLGGGTLLYPNHPVYVAGLFDLLQFRVAQDDMHVYFDFQFAALTNPFQAPEGYFHQRLEVYIETGNKMGCTEMQIGPHRLQTNPDWGWSYRLSVAPFGESRLYVVDGQSVQAFSEGVGSQSLSASQTIRVQVPRELLPHPDPAWGYYVLVGSFDGLARDFWRDLGEGPWQVGGSGVPIFDLLAPRLGARTQRAQLTKGILYPVSKNRVHLVPYLLGAMGTGTVIVCFFLWRWRHGRT